MKIDNYHFTKEDFVKVWKKYIPKCSTINFYDSTFGYFEMKPYRDESKIRFNIESIEHCQDGTLLFKCHVRVKEFHVGNKYVDESEFLKFTEGDVSFHNNDEILSELNKIQLEYEKI